MSIPESRIKVGVVGAGRGMSFARGSGAAGLELAAICDISEEKLEKAGEEFSVPTFTEYSRFLESDIDAVILANYFNEHAPYAIKALEAGKHVMSETSCNSTLAEGVALCSAVEKAGRIYMLAENYPYTAFNQEMRRLYANGEIGEVTYADGEYNHPMSPAGRMKISPGEEHWRNWLPSTYYCTHALAPLVYITGEMPVKVNALSISCPSVDELTLRVGDQGSVILCRMGNGSVFRLFGLIMPGHSNWYRIHGSRGAMELTRGPGYFGPEQIRIWHEEWDLMPGDKKEVTYVPDFPELAEQARKSGHGGGDFWTNYHFSEAIRTGKQPFLDVYRGVAMSSVGILAWKSALSDGSPFSVPDFSDIESRKIYENDDWSPFPKDKKPGQPPPGMFGLRVPDEKARMYTYKIWEEVWDNSK